MSSEEVLFIITLSSFVGYWIVATYVENRTVRNNKEDNVKSNKKSNNNSGNSEDYSQRTENNKTDNNKSSYEEKYDKRDGIKNVDQNNWHIILGVSSNASISDIKTAYRNKITGYHPDKVATLANEFKIIAERRSKQINAAYQIAIKLRK